MASRPSDLRWVSADARAEALAALGIAAVTHRCQRCGSSEHGQPSSPGTVGLSISKADGLVLVAAADRLVGIDHEPLGADVARDVVAHERDRGDALRLWVRKEAVLKATGRGLQVDPRTFWIDRRGGTSRIPGYDGPPLRVDDLEVAGHVAAIAYALSQT